jgi:hypothetical protein
MASPRSKELDISLAVTIEALRTEFDEPGACYSNVSKCVAKNGGKAVFGWLKTDTVFDALPLIQTWIHHCAWESPEGKVFEITPYVKRVFPDKSLLAVLSDEFSFIRDDAAQLISLPDGRYQSRTPRYTVIRDAERVRKGIEYMMNADRKLHAGDLKGEAYWCARAGEVLGGEILPLGAFGVKTMAPFSLRDA